VTALAYTTPPPASELDELTLRRAQRRDPQAERALILTYQKAVFALLSRMLGPVGRRGLVEDLCQETFLRVFRSLDRFVPNGPARLSTWILTIATRLALHELERRPHAGATSADALDLLASDRPDEAAERRSTAAAVRRAVARLPPERRSVVVLREYHQLEYDEIARALEIDRGTVKSRLARGRAELRDALKGLDA
jgi:RNA polymerase sigma-70 factor (ECF subfamily)